MNIAVLKLGGSILRDASSYRSWALFIRDRLRNEPWMRLVIVVSARYGETDDLLALATSLSAIPDSQTLDLLWSSGEIKSAATLALAFQALGIRAIALDVHQSGMGWIERLDVDPFPVRRALEAHEVVIVPGFLASAGDGRVVTLGRGGSDLSAVAIAAALGAGQCELLKDVPGYFTADPHVDPNAEHLPAVDYRGALQMAHDGCDLVQAAALDAVRRARRAIVYVSCDPATLARDARILVDGGYQIECVTPIDQFVFSAEVETVAVLRRAGHARPSSKRTT